jgi:hypothetical protein
MAMGTSVVRLAIAGLAFPGRRAPSAADDVRPHLPLGHTNTTLSSFSLNLPGPLQSIGLCCCGSAHAFPCRLSSLQIQRGLWQIHMELRASLVL